MHKLCYVLKSFGKITTPASKYQCRYGSLPQHLNYYKSLQKQTVLLAHRHWRTFLVKHPPAAIKIMIYKLFTS